MEKNNSIMTKITNDKDTRYYHALIQKAKQEEIDLDYTRNEIFQLAMQKGSEWFKDTEFYSEKDATRAFLLGFSQWLWDYQNERDITIRRGWYLQYKQYAQKLWYKKHKEGNYKTNFNTTYSGMLSTVLWELIRNNDLCYYSSFSVKDVSRKIWYNKEKGWKNVFIFGEKTATTPYFRKTCEILGLKVLYSAGGKPSAAGTEGIFFNSEDFDKELPVLLLTLTDYDRDGQRGVESGGYKQAKVYCDRKGLKLTHKRIGVDPSDIKTMFDETGDEKYLLTPEGSCFILPNQPDESSVTDEKVKEIVKRLTRKEKQTDISEITGISKGKIGKINKAVREFWDIEDIITEFASWELQYGIPYNDPDTGETIYLGIEIEALATDYYYEKILEAILEFYSIEDMSNYARDLHTPNETDYSEKATEYSQELAKDNDEYQEFSKEIKDLEVQVRYLQNKQDVIVQDIKNNLWDTAQEIYEETSFDNRQRKWDSETENWCEDSVKTMIDVHDILIKEAVKKQTHFTDVENSMIWSGNQTLRFKKSQLLSKLVEELGKLIDDSEIDLPDDFDFESLMKPAKYQCPDCELVIFDIPDSDKQINCPECSQWIDVEGQEIAEETRETSETNETDLSLLKKLLNEFDNITKKDIDIEIDLSDKEKERMEALFDEMDSDSEEEA